MYTKAEIQQRVSYLRSLSPVGTENLFAELNSTIENYFQRDEDFANLLRDTMLRLLSDCINRNIKVEYEERLPAMSTDFPEGYSDVTEIFGGNIFREIMTVDEEEFINTFRSESQSNGSNNSTIIWSNAYITTWNVEITAQKNSESGKLEKISEFCLRCNKDRALAYETEELGQIEQTWTKEKRQLGKWIYKDCGYDWIIGNFNLSIFEPHYLPELE